MSFDHGAGPGLLLDELFSHKFEVNTSELTVLFEL